MEKLSRRDLLSRVGVAAGTVTLAGCAAQPDSQVNQTQTDPPNNRSGPTRGDSLAGAATGGDDLRDLLIKDDNIFEYWGSYDPNEYSLSTPSGGYEAGTSSIYNDWHTGYVALIIDGPGEPGENELEKRLASGQSHQIGRWELWLDGSVGNPGYWLGEHS